MKHRAVIQNNLFRASGSYLAIRQALHDADVFSVALLGGPGCGKSTLMDATIAQVTPRLNVGVIVCEMDLHRTMDPPCTLDARVAHVKARDDGIPPAGVFAEALERVGTGWIDLLFIEHIGSLTMRALPNFGQDATVTIFSVAAGDDKADKHPELVRASDVVILNKTDLLPSVPFHVQRFRDDVTRIHSGAELIELSALNGQGVDQWVEWLRARTPHRRNGDRAQIGTWFG